MKTVILFLLLLTTAFGAHVESFKWANGESYLAFLKRNNLPFKELYANLDDEDKKSVEDIRSRVNYQILFNDTDHSIEQILIPLNDELQIHIYKKDGKWQFEAIPIISITKTQGVALAINFSPYYDLIKKTGSIKLATIFMQGYKNTLDFKSSIRKGDRLAMIYDQKYRLGHPFSMPTLKASVVELHKRKHYIYLNSDDRYYNEKAKQVEGFLFGMPLEHVRITSRFTLKRWHPVLHKYRAHLGVDMGARRGTPIHAAGKGRVIYAGWMRGYGNVIKIRHEDGYVTLYAHQKRFRSGIRRGRRVAKGEIIGYVGNTGISTGPHLHFGLYHNGRPINPLKVVQITKKELRGKKLKAFYALKKKYDKELEDLLEAVDQVKKQRKFFRLCYCNNPLVQPAMKKEQKDAENRD